MPAIVLAVVLLLALPASQIPAWDFEWDPRACCCDKAGPCPCPEHELPEHEDEPSFRACGSGGNYVTTAQAPELGMPPLVAAIDAPAAPAAPIPVPGAPHAPPELERPRGPS